MSFRIRLILGMTLTVLFALVVTSVVITLLTANNVSQYSKQRYQQELTAKLNLISDQVSDRFSFYSRQIEQMAGQTAILEAADAFIFDFNNYLDQNRNDEATSRAAVKQYYETEFVPRLANAEQAKVGSSPYWGDLSETAIYMQYSFIANNPNDVGSKDELANARDWDRTAYAFEHRNRHGDFRSFLKQFGYYDVFLVDAESQNIVYSVYKEIDFATSLETGPFRDSGIAEAFRGALQLPPGESYMTEFEPYAPSYFAPASFMSSPIYDDDKLKAVLIFQLPLDAIESIMTRDGQWQEYGFGETGEALLVGRDRTLRTGFRQAIESPDEFYQEMNSIDPELSDQMQDHSTTVTYLPMELESVDRAFNGEQGFMVEPGIFGRDQYTAYKPFSFKGINWALISTNEASETDQQVDDLLASMAGLSGLATVIMVFVSAVIAVIIANLLVRPLSRLAQRFKALTSEEADLTTRVDAAGIPEIDQITHHFNQFIEQIQQIVVNVKQSSKKMFEASTHLNEATETSSKLSQDQLRESTQATDYVQQFTVEFDRVAERGTEASEQTELARKSANSSSAQSSDASDTISELVREITRSSDALGNVEAEVASINEVLMQITAIADQTNLLALNAAIEAARAGDSGRGFAVVADEVRGLAQRTQESTVQIREKTETLNNVVAEAVNSMSVAKQGGEQGLSLVESVTGSIRSLDEAVQHLAEINEDIARSAQEQKGTAHSVSQNVAVVKTASEELSDASTKVASSAAELSELAVHLRDDVERFQT